MQIDPPKFPKGFCPDGFFSKFVKSHIAFCMRSCVHLHTCIQMYSGAYSKITILNDNAHCYQLSISELQLFSLNPAICSREKNMATVHSLQTWDDSSA